jgi:hypothetical protein
MTFSEWFSDFKSSPATWDAFLPILAALGTHYAYYWWVPLVAIVLAFFIPAKSAPQAQRIHFMIGYLCTSVLHFWGLFFIPVAAYLEFIFDPKNEGDPIFWGGMTDFTSYMVGLAVGCIRLG